MSQFRMCQRNSVTSVGTSFTVLRKALLRGCHCAAFLESSRKHRPVLRCNSRRNVHAVAFQAPILSDCQRFKAVVLPQLKQIRSTFNSSWLAFHARTEVIIEILSKGCCLFPLVGLCLLVLEWRRPKRMFSDFILFVFIY